MTIDGFRTTFDGGKSDHEGFYAFRNHISGGVPEFRSIIVNLHFLGSVRPECGRMVFW